MKEWKNGKRYLKEVEQQERMKLIRVLNLLVPQNGLETNNQNNIRKMNRPTSSGKK